MGKPYAQFLQTICSALRAGNAGTLIAKLPYYQYNSGVRYGMYGGGPGQMGNPSLIRTWMGGGHPQCHLYTPGIQGHGAILTSGWKIGPWAILEADLFSHKWRINDFTFGSQSKLRAALQTAGPVLTYHGR